jgi:hypothetical protein
VPEYRSSGLLEYGASGQVSGFRVSLTSTGALRAGGVSARRSDVLREWAFFRRDAHGNLTRADQDIRLSGTTP